MVTIFGMGYVGLTLALFFAKKGVKVIGYDISEERINSLLSKKSYVLESGIDDLLASSIDKGLFLPKVLDKNTLDAETKLAFITIGTSLFNGSVRKSEERLFELCLQVDAAGFSTIVLRSTVAVGTCKKISSKLTNSKIVFAPERTVEGVAMEELQHLPQIIGGENAQSMYEVESLFKLLEVKVLSTESWEEAELAKLACNTYRDYNFAFSNAMVGMANIQNIDGNSVLKLASQSYDRMPFMLPGPVSGPCLTKDTYILRQSFSQSIDEAELLILARSINDSTNEKIISQISCLAKTKKVSFWGTSFKSDPDTSDTRESHTLAIIKQLELNNFDIEVFDPYIDNEGKKELSHLIVTSPSLDQDRVIVFGSWPKWIQEFIASDLVSDSIEGVTKYWCYPIKDSYKFNNSFRFGQILGQNKVI